MPSSLSSSPLSLLLVSLILPVVLLFRSSQPRNVTRQTVSVGLVNGIRMSSRREIIFIWRQVDLRLHMDWRNYRVTINGGESRLSRPI